MKPAKCKICKQPFDKRSMAHVCCSFQCAMEYSRRNRLKAERKETKAKREKLKRRSEWLADAQKAVNAFIRYRDKDLPCISCGRHHQGQYHAGHYRTVKAAPELRFHEMNIHKQCMPCNKNLSGNIVEYRKNLIIKIGIENVEWLTGPHQPARYTIEDAKDIKAYYRNKLKQLKGNQSDR